MAAETILSTIASTEVKLFRKQVERRAIQQNHSVAITVLRLRQSRNSFDPFTELGQQLRRAGSSKLRYEPGREGGGAAAVAQAVLARRGSAFKGRYALRP